MIHVHVARAFDVHFVVTIHVHVARVFDVHFVVTLYGTCTYMYTCTVVNATKSVQHLLYSVYCNTV